MKITIIPMKDYHETSGILSVGVGSIHTTIPLRDGIFHYPAGIAHFLEHKIFELADHKDAMQEFSKLNVESNAFTEFTSTAYTFQSSHRILEAITLLFEMIASVNFTDVSINQEREIIRQEILMYQDDPDSYLRQKLLAALYPASPLANDIAGSTSSIKEIHQSVLEEFYWNFYQPQNMHLVLVGQVDQQVVSAIDSLPFQKRELQVKDVPTIDFCSALPVAFLELELMVSSPKFALGYRGSQVMNGDVFHYKLLLSLYCQLALGSLSEKYDELYQSGKVDTSFTIEVEVNRYFQYLIIYSDSPAPNEVLEELSDYMEELQSTSSFTDSQLVLEKNKWHANFLRSLNSVDGLATEYSLFWESCYSYLDIPQLLEDLSLEEVLQVGRDFSQTAFVSKCVVTPIEKRPQSL
ncbi:peptidase, M16 family [Streptococcus sp. DD13]|nr:pitrilysin family protein [Streptococcus sp. DD13]KXT77762.1 peptidase, M16 family [Streptococcus sp. DD13]